MYEFLCEERGFSKDRVERVVERMKRFNLKYQQTTLNNFNPD
ncbi:MAG: hypothetical protein RMJ31_07510 [Nitrososphaerota archaeon]|nr:hypothetical protein [Nitrososphaerota archaeon]